MSSLEAYKLNYEDLTPKTRKGGKVIKMAKTTNTPEQATSKKKYAKTRGEHIKDVIIAMLVTGIVAFGFGLQFASAQEARVNQAVEAATVVETVEAPVSK